ncbi:hypothetical protein C0389_04200 [bacterium]|nr:hypothetical protein [bacterium]
MKKNILILLTVFIFSSCEKEVFVGVEEDIHTSFGKIFVESNPKGYKVYIDNKNWGVLTPDSVLWLTEGKHKLSLKHDLFSDSNMTVTINRTGSQALSIDMLSNPRFYANVICYSIPSGSRIFLNDLPTGKITPAIINKVYPGIIEVKLLHEGCRDDSVNIKVKGGQYTELYRTLNDTTRGVDYRTINSKIFSDELSKVVVDKYNNKWIGTIAHGLIKFDGKNWTSYENSNILNSNIITDMIIDSKERMWVGTPEGLSVFNGVTWQSYDDKLPSLTVTALEEDPFGNIWIGTNNGLVKYNNSSFQLFNKGNSGLPENIITCITFAKNGDLWLGTSQYGVVEFSNNKWTSYFNMIRRFDSSISYYVGALTFDKNGVLWVFHLGAPKTGRNALMKYYGDELNEFHLPLLFPAEVVSFYVDAENNIWISAKEGLIKYNETKPIKVFNNYEYGFYVKHCTSIVFDKNGDIWASTMGGGLVKLKKEFFQ